MINIGNTDEGNLDRYAIGVDSIGLFYAKSPNHSGTLNSLNIRISGNWSSSEYGRLAIFQSSNRALIAQGSPFNGDGTIHWVSCSVGPSGINANTDYILATWEDDLIKSTMTSPNLGHFWRDTNSSRDYSASGNGDFSKYLDPLDSHDEYSTHVTTEQVQMYAAYTAYDKDILIYYGGMTDNECINCWCSRWDVQNYNIIIETWLKKSDLQTLRDSIRPGATGELYKILGRPRFYDKSWTGANTIKLTPNSDFQLYNMREEKLMFIKNIIDSPLEGDSGWIAVKIEGLLSGATSL